jgi:hypothetical protein
MGRPAYPAGYREVPTRVDAVVPTAAPVRGRIVIRRGPPPGNAWSSTGGNVEPEAGTSSLPSEMETRRNSSGFSGDSYRRGVRFRGLDRGRLARASMATRSGDGPSRDASACSASDSRSVRFGRVTCGDDLRSALTLRTGLWGLLGADGRELVSEPCPCILTAKSFAIS